MSINTSFTTYFNRDRTVDLFSKDRGRKRTKTGRYAWSSY